MFLAPREIINRAIDEAVLSPIQVELIRYLYLSEDDELPKIGSGNYRHPPSISSFLRSHPEYQVPSNASRTPGKPRNPTLPEVRAELDEALQKLRACMKLKNLNAVADVISVDAAPSGKRSLPKGSNTSAVRNASKYASLAATADFHLDTSSLK